MAEILGPDPYWEKSPATLQPWQTKSVDTIYQAATDGFVLLTEVHAAGDTKYEIRSDAATPPTTVRAMGYVSAYTGAVSLHSPVRKGHYWTVVTVIGAQVPALFWIPQS